jgi:hypothetical protein
MKFAAIVDMADIAGMQPEPFFRSQKAPPTNVSTQGNLVLWGLPTCRWFFIDQFRAHADKRAVEHTKPSKYAARFGGWAGCYAALPANSRVTSIMEGGKGHRHLVMTSAFAVAIGGLADVTQASPR